MKKSLISFIIVLSLFAAFLLQIPSVASASLNDFTFDPITDEYTFELSENGNYYILTGVPKKTVEIVVPDEYEGKPVMGIANDAFQRAYAYGETFILSENIFYFDSIILRSNARKLKYNEYENGQYLGTKDNPYYALVGVIDKTVTEFVLHDDAQIITDYAFSGVKELNKVILSPNFKFMGARALINRSGSNDAEAELEYTEYGNCYYLGTAENPYHVMVKLTDANVTSISLHPQTKVIMQSSFRMHQWGRFEEDTSSESAKKLETVTIPKSVKAIGSWAFSGCSALKEINFEAQSIDDFDLFDMSGMPENVTLNWNYGNESPSEEATSDNSLSQSPNNDKPDNNYIWIIVGISAVAVISAVIVVLKKRK